MRFLLRRSARDASSNTKTSVARRLAASFSAGAALIFHLAAIEAHEDL
jgi:hypothetical protein